MGEPAEGMLKPSCLMAVSLFPGWYNKKQEAFAGEWTMQKPGCEEARNPEFKASTAPLTEPTPSNMAPAAA